MEPNPEADLEPEPPTNHVQLQNGPVDIDTVFDRVRERGMPMSKVRVTDLSREVRALIMPGLDRLPEVLMCNRCASFSIALRNCSARDVETKIRSQFERHRRQSRSDHSGARLCQAATDADGNPVYIDDQSLTQRILAAQGAIASDRDNADLAVARIIATRQWLRVVDMALNGVAIEGSKEVKRSNEATAARRA